MSELELDSTTTDLSDMSVNQHYQSIATNNNNNNTNSNNTIPIPKHPLSIESSSGSGRGRRQIQSAALINNIPTELIIINYDNCIQILLTQQSRIGSIIKAEWAGNELGFDISNTANNNIDTYSITTLLGSRTGFQHTLYTLLARQIINNIINPDTVNTDTDTDNTDNNNNNNNNKSNNNNKYLLLCCALKPIKSIDNNSNNSSDSIESTGLILVRTLMKFILDNKLW